MLTPKMRLFGRTLHVRCPQGRRDNARNGTSTCIQTESAPRLRLMRTLCSSGMSSIHQSQLTRACLNSAYDRVGSSTRKIKQVEPALTDRPRQDVANRLRTLLREREQREQQVVDVSDDDDDVAGWQRHQTEDEGCTSGFSFKAGWRASSAQPPSSGGHTDAHIRRARLGVLAHAGEW